MSLDTATKNAIIAEYATSEGDTGPAGVQIAPPTRPITALPQQPQAASTVTDCLRRSGQRSLAGEGPRRRGHPARPVTRRAPHRSSARC